MSKTIKELDKISREFEAKYWVAPKGRKAKTRHILLHITKTLGKLGKVVEKWEHGFKVDESAIKKDVIPDLFMYSLMLAREEGADLEELFMKRLEANKEKVSKWIDDGEVKELPKF